jgi:two-component system chemotaxis response regulator CheY
MMPKLDGLKVLKTLRELESERGVEPMARVKIIMTSALNDKKTVAGSFEYGCEAFEWKPIDMRKFSETMKSIGLL